MRVGKGSGAAPGSQPTVCAVQGVGQVAFSRDSYRRAHARSAGRRTRHHKPCTSCQGAGASHERKITSRFRPALRPDSSCASRTKAAGRPAAVGHLYVVVHVQEHEFFRRDGMNLFASAVNFTTLALGGEIQLPTLDFTENVKVAEGTQTGTTLRLRHKGMPDVNGRGRGDLFATVQVQTPKKLTREQRKLIDELAKVLPKEKFEPRPRAGDESQDERNLFDRVETLFG